MKNMQKCPAFWQGIFLFEKGLTEFVSCRSAKTPRPKAGSFSVFRFSMDLFYHVSASSKSTRSGRTGSSPMTVCM